MTSNSKTAAVKGFAKNFMSRMIGQRIRGKLLEAKKADDQRFALIISTCLLFSIAGLFYYNHKSAQYIEEVRKNENGGEPRFYDTLFNFCVAVAVLALVMAVKRVYDKRQRDFKPSMHIEQITEEDFRYQQKHLTRQEVLKLHNDPLYKQLEDVKGKAIEDWNWQMKEHSLAKKESKSGSPVKQPMPLQDDNEDSMEKELLRMDEEITKDGGHWLKGGSSSVQKLNRQTSQRTKRTPMTQDTVSKQLLDDVY